ncbi:hypothetical protein EYF80_053978 [Liparis tanakae]|uniref:Uncharacterized protein n=1 Tax=Liparis tanakae TaxID=230148 RepID=A0A4Z2F451_9TELE|nr:hypothetical protein EYF80_053978 [Liparis tanakae]
MPKLNDSSSSSFMLSGSICCSWNSPCPLALQTNPNHYDSEYKLTLYHRSLLVGLMTRSVHGAKRHQRDLTACLRAVSPAHACRSVHGAARAHRDLTACLRAVSPAHACRSVHGAARAHCNLNPKVTDFFPMHVNAL